MKFGKFFGRESQPQKSEWELEQERMAQEAKVQLSTIELNSEEIINSLSPEEVKDLNFRIADLLNKIPREEIGDELLALSEEEKDKIPELYDDNEIIKYIDSQSPRLREYMNQIIQDRLDSFKIGERFREYDKEHWQEVFKNRINSGITPFGDERQLIKDIFLKQGIDLEHPTQGDINAYFQGLEYHGGSISTEISRRRKNEYGDLTPFQRETTSILLARLLIKNKTGGGQYEDFYHGDELIERLKTIKEEIQS